jgi:large subunit ribosomal protein L30
MYVLRLMTNKIMSQVKITQVKSTIKRPEVQKRTIKALGLGKLNSSVVKELNPAIQGMIRAVQHMIVVENI